MLQITNRDKIFIIVALPVAVALCYWFLLRRPIAAEYSVCENQAMSLASAEQYEAENLMLNRQLAAAREKLQNEKNKAGEGADAKVSGGLSSAERLEKVLNVFAANNVRIITSEAQPDNGARPAGKVMRDLFGIKDPHLRLFSAEGAYANVVSALQSFSIRENQVIVESVSLTTGRLGCKWTVLLWF